MDQNEIDALMGDDADDGASDSGELSQADIDAAMGNPAPAPSAQASGDAFDSGDGDEGFSQADIDALMGGGAGGDESAAAPAAPAPAPAGEGPALDSEGRPLDEMGAAMAAAIAEEQAAAAQAASAAPTAADVPLEEIELPSFDQEEVYTEYTQPISLLHDVQLHVKIELGRTRMFVEDVLRLSEGSVVELDRLAGDPVDVFVNDRLIARGEVLVLNDNFCVRISEIISDSETRAAG